eukprot:11185761-Alexandrium_andersonii.AAC.1
MSALHVHGPTRHQGADRWLALNVSRDACIGAVRAQISSSGQSAPGGPTPTSARGCPSKGPRATPGIGQGGQTSTSANAQAEPAPGGPAGPREKGPTETGNAMSHRAERSGHRGCKHLRLAE